MDKKRTPLELRFHTDHQKTRQSTEAEIINKATTDIDFREKLLKDPKSTIEQQLGITLPEKLNIRVVEETSDDMILVLPYTMNDSDLESLKAFATESHLAANNTGKTAIQLGCCC